MQNQPGAGLVPRKFVSTADGVINDDYETGIELAKILSADPPVSGAMLAETAKKTDLHEGYGGSVSQHEDGLR